MIENNEIRARILERNTAANVCGYMVRFDNGNEKLFAIDKNKNCYESPERKFSVNFDGRFSKCSTVPDNAEFIGYYKINI